MKFLGVPWCEVCRSTPSKIKDKLSHLTPLTTKKEAQFLVDLIWFWRHHSSYLGVLFWLTSWIAAHFEWGSEQDQALWQVWAAVQSCSVTPVIWSSRINMQHRPLGLGILCTYLCPFRETPPGLPLGLSRDQTFSHWSGCLPYDLSCPSRTKCYLTHQAIDVDVYSGIPSASRAVVYLIGPKRTLKV